MIVEALPGQKGSRPTTPGQGSITRRGKKVSGRLRLTLPEKANETRPATQIAQSSKRKLEKNFSTDRMDLGSGAHEHTIPMLITHGISHWEKR
jgi:hypothetical protein